MSIHTERYCEGCEMPVSETDWTEDDRCAYPLHEYTTKIEITVKR